MDTWARPEELREGFQEEVPPALKLEARGKGKGTPEQRCEATLCREERWRRQAGAAWIWYTGQAESPRGWLVFSFY